MKTSGIRMGSILVAVSISLLCSAESASLREIVAWGYNSAGECNPPPGSNYKAVVGGCFWSLALKSDGSKVRPSLARQFAALDPGLPVGEVRRLEDLLAQSIGPQRFSTILLGTFAVSALSLAAVTLGVTAPAVIASLVPACRATRIDAVAALRGGIAMGLRAVCSRPGGMFETRADFPRGSHGWEPDCVIVRIVRMEGRVAGVPKEPLSSNPAQV